MDPSDFVHLGSGKLTIIRFQIPMKDFFPLLPTRRLPPTRHVSSIRPIRTAFLDRPRRMTMNERLNDLTKVIPYGIFGDLTAGPLAFPDEMGKVTTTAVLHDEVDDAAVRVEDLGRVEYVCVCVCVSEGIGEVEREREWHQSGVQSTSFGRLAVTITSNA